LLSEVIEIFFYLFFRIARRFMLRMQREINRLQIVTKFWTLVGVGLKF